MHPFALSIYIEIKLLGCETEEVFLLIMRNCFNTVKHPEVILNHSFSWKIFKVHWFSVKLEIFSSFVFLCSSRFLVVTHWDFHLHSHDMWWYRENVLMLLVSLVILYKVLVHFCHFFVVDFFLWFFFIICRVSYTFQLWIVCQKCTL